MISSALRPRRSHAAERGERGGVFSAQRAGGNHHRALLGHAEEAQHAIAALSVRTDAGPVERIELQAAGDDDLLARGAEIDDAARGFFALHAEAIDVGQHAAEQRAHEAIARIRAAGDAAVGEHRGDAARAAGAQQVRPDLRLHHHEQARFDDVERARDGDGPVERKVEHAIDVGQLLRDLLARHRGGGEINLQRGKPLFEVGEQRARGERLSDRDRVNPDGGFAVDIERERQVAETLADAANVLAMPHRLKNQVRRRNQQEDEAEQTVERVHWAGQPRV